MTDTELRALDAEIHAKVFGKPVRTCKYGFHWTDEIGLLGALRVPKYTADMAQTWLVVERMRGAWHFQLKTEDVEWAAKFGKIDPTDFDICTWEFEPTAPLAICRAALAALTPA
jgi:hypothetical protein